MGRVAELSDAPEPRQALGASVGEGGRGGGHAEYREMREDAESSLSEL